MIAGKRATGAVAIRRRLTPYWQMEAANVALLPAFALWVASPNSAVELAAMLIALAPACLLLMVGAFYWYAVVRRTEGRGAPARLLMGVLDRAEAPVVALIGVSWATDTALIALHGWSIPLVAALVCTVLATLEYVNYFKVQLQNFDHRPDLSRLLRGKGLRRAHLGRDLADYRRSRRP